MSDAPKKRPPVVRPTAPNRLVAYSWLGEQIHALREGPNAIEDARLLRFSETSGGDDVVAYVREDLVRTEQDALLNLTTDCINRGDLGGLRALYGLPREERKGLDARGLTLLIRAVGKLLQTGLEAKTRPLASLKNAAKGALFLLEQQKLGPFEALPVDLADGKGTPK